jgi:DNA repair protein RecO
MPSHKSRAFVLESREYRESSQLVRLFCEKEGLVSLVARGVRGAKSQKAAAFGAFNMVQVTYALKEGASLGSLTSVEIDRIFAGLRSSLEGYALSTYWFEVLGGVLQVGLPAPELFELTLSFLETLETESPSAQVVAGHFLGLLAALGIGFQTAHCGKCGVETDLVHFDVGSHSLVCASCASPGEPYYPVPATLAQILQIGGTGRWTGRDGGLAGEPFRDFLYLFHHVARELLERHVRSFGFLLDTLDATRGAGTGKK